MIEKVFIIVEYIWLGTERHLGQQLFNDLDVSLFQSSPKTVFAPNLLEIIRNVGNLTVFFILFFII